MSWFKETIAAKKKALSNLAAEPMAALADKCALVWNNVEKLDQVLQESISQLKPCHMVFAVDTKGFLISSNVATDMMDGRWRGRDLTDRPYLKSTLPYQGFTMSPVYTSRHNMRPCITVMQAVRHEDEILGFIAADYAVDDLPTPKEQDKGVGGWKQFKGDPAIRGTLFMQERVVSAMDKVLNETIEIITDMMQHHGIFHCKIHFSSSRISMWSVEDPYDYNIHMVDEIIDPERCLAYPRQPLHERAQVNEDEIGMVLNLFKELRYADETVYLRSASFNIVNGNVGLTFSCDGSHYIHFTEFLNKDTGFWFGTSGESDVVSS